MPQLNYVKLEDLLLWVENPRFENIPEESMSLNEMFDMLPEKVFNLASDISENGILDVVAILNDNGIYTVYDGNRRISAFKILMKPNLVDYNKKYYQKFSSLKLSNDDYKNNIPANIFEKDEIKKLFLLLERKHSGEDNGRGLIPWRPEQKARFDNKLGKATPLQNALDFLVENKYLSKDELDSVTRTNWERILPRQTTQSFAKYEYKNGKIVIKDEKEFKSKIKDIADELKDKPVKEVYDIQAIEKFIGTVSDKYNIPSEVEESNSEQLAFTSDLANINNSTEVRKEEEKVAIPIIKNVRNIKPSYTRKYLIPSSTKIQIKNTRLNNIYHELRTLDIEKYSNGIAVLFRVFIELSIENYLEKNKIANITNDDTLNKKLIAALKDIKQKKLLTENQIKPIDTAISNPKSIFSINTFNAYVHKEEFNPVPTDLLLVWDNFTEFIKILWS